MSPELFKASRSDSLAFGARVLSERHRLPLDLRRVRFNKSRCPKASSAALRLKASPNTACRTACACCCSPINRSRPSPSTSLIWSARATRTTARPAWRTCSSTWCSRASPKHREHPAGADRARRAAQRLDLVRPHELLRDLRGDRRESGVGARSRSRPHGQFVHRQERSRQRDDRRAQ